jgi:hypothetical protein
MKNSTNSQNQNQNQNPTQIDKSIIGQWFQSSRRIYHIDDKFGTSTPYIGNVKGLVVKFDKKRVYILNTRGIITSITHLSFSKFNDFSKEVPQNLLEIQQILLTNELFNIDEILSKVRQSISENLLDYLKIKSALGF